MDRIKLVVVLNILFILATFLISIFRENIFYILLAYLALLELIYWKASGKENKYDRYLILLIFIIFLASRFIFIGLDQSTLVLRTAAITAFSLLNLVLLIGPWSRFSNKINGLYFYRRHLGVSLLFLAYLHVSIVISNYYSYSIAAAFKSIFVFYGFTAFFLLFWLGVTSWDYLQVNVPRIGWKILHGALLLFYIGISYYVYGIHKGSEGILFHLSMMTLFTIIWVIIAPYSIIKKFMNTRVFGWKQIHVLIYIIYFSLILHVWFGVVSFSNLIVKIVFLTLPVIVIGSHLYGWIAKISEDKRIYNKIKKINKIIKKGGKEFVGIAFVKDFEDGRIEKFYVNKKPIAVFKKEKKFFAVSNVCAHQKGPLNLGKVVGENIECPWHYWVFNVKDGNYLGKEKFCLPIYETKVVKGILFVSIEAVNKKDVKVP